MLILCKPIAPDDCCCPSAGVSFFRARQARHRVERAVAVVLDLRLRPDAPRRFGPTMPTAHRSRRTPIAAQAGPPSFFGLGGRTYGYALEDDYASRFCEIAGECAGALPIAVIRRARRCAAGT